MDSGRGDEVVGRSTEHDPIVARAVRVDAATVDPLLGLEGHPLVMWRQPAGPAIAGADAVVTIQATGSDRFQRAQARAESVGDRLAYEGPPAARPRFLGGFAFEETTPSSRTWAAFPGAWFVLPAMQLVSTADGTWLTVVAEGETPPVQAAVDRLAAVDSDGTTGVPSLPTLATQQPSPPRSRWLEQVGEIQDGIAAGRFRKAVLGHTTEATLTGRPHPVALGRRLGNAHPQCYRFVLAPDPGTFFIGASPERLVEGRGRCLRTDALAGSRRRGDEPTADRELAAALQESSKDAFEHEVVVEAIRERLTQCCQDVTIGARSIRQLESVQHLHTEISATRPTECHLLDVAETLHPTPAVGGMPREPALAALQQVESFERGWYAGPVGWFDTQGDGQFAIGIRSAVITGRDATLFAGAGIVAESDPAAEWEELQLKYQPIRSNFRER